MAYQNFMYEDLGDDRFERLVVLLGQELFGAAMQGFATGPDGGRDAKFVGTACAFPNSSHPWTGITIFQAKHTVGHNCKFGDTDFFNPTSGTCVVSKEVPRINKLRKIGKLNNYALISNRRLSAGAEEKIHDHLVKECGLEYANVFLCGVEQMELWLKKYPHVVKLAELDPIDSPLIISPEQLAEVVEAFVDGKDDIVQAASDISTPRISHEEKNKLNNMTPEFAKQLRKLYLKDERQIQNFLAMPQNSSSREAYNEVVEEFNLKVVAKRKGYQSFDDVYNYIIDMLLKRDPVLRRRGNQRITRALVFYMYWHCDLGLSSDA